MKGPAVKGRGRSLLRAACCGLAGDDSAVAGAAAPLTSVASCAATMLARARADSLASRPWRTSAAITPTHPVGPRIGTTTAPGDMPLVRTICISACLKAAAVALSACRGIVGNFASVCCV